MRLLKSEIKCHKKKNNKISEEEVVCWFNYDIERTFLHLKEKYSNRTIYIRKNLFMKELEKIRKLVNEKSIKKNIVLTLGINIGIYINREKISKNDEPDQRIQFMIHIDSISIKLSGKYLNTEENKFFSTQKHNELFHRYLETLLSILPDSVFKSILKIFFEVEKELK